MTAKKILFVLESRSTYGYAKNVFAAMQQGFPELEITSIITGMHLIESLGESLALIERDGFPIGAKVRMSPDHTAKSGWSVALGEAISGYAKAYEELSPDIVLLFGDRVETFGALVAASYMGIACAHIQAGDKSGHIDDQSRMAMAKLAHIHFASCADSAERLRKLGEQDFRIHLVGAPQLDDIVSGDYYEADKKIETDDEFILLVQHPVMAHHETARQEMLMTMDACLRTGFSIYCVYPNSDHGYDGIVDAISKHNGHDRVHVFQNLERSAYLDLLSRCALLIGNSSSGILEAPSFKIPVVNIGDRQRGRPQASNIINSEHDREDIEKSIQKALYDAAFKTECALAVNPYGDGNNGQKICQILQNTVIDTALLDKQTVY